MLDGFDCLFLRQHAGNREKAGLHDGIDALAHAAFFRHRIAVDHIKADILRQHLLLHGFGQTFPNMVGRFLRVQQKHRVVGGVDQHVVAFKKNGLMATDEIGIVFGYQIGGFDRFGAEAQMRHRDRAGLLGVVNEIALGEILGFLADDLDGVFVGPDRAVAAQAVKHGLEGADMAIGPEIGIPAQTGVRDVVVYADGKLVFGLRVFEFVEDSLDHAGREFLGRQAVTAAHHFRHRGELAIAANHILGNRAQYVFIQRFAIGARFLGAIQHGDFAAGGRQGRQ